LCRVLRSCDGREQMPIRRRDQSKNSTRGMSIPNRASCILRAGNIEL
jgi:hypothetical protein